MQTQLDECRRLYNELIEQRKLAYEELDISLSKYQQSMLLPLLKAERPTLDKVHSQVLQNVVDRLDKAFQAFSVDARRVRSLAFRFVTLRLSTSALRTVDKLGVEEVVRKMRAEGACV